MKYNIYMYYNFKMTFDNFELYLCSVPLLLSGKQVFLAGQILLFSCENKLLPEVI